jgi:FAD/FMN-containing dehydrogenase
MNKTRASRFTRRQLLTGIAGGLVFQTVSRKLTKGLPGFVTAIGQSDLDKFRASIKGQLILPGDKDYDQIRRVQSFNPDSDRHPQMIMRCFEPADVIKSIAFARDKNMEVAVRAGGHDLLGASVCDGMVIDLSRMKEMNFDHQRLTSRVAAGVRAGELNAFTQQAGLAAVLGCSPGVGVAGLTLGGGLGWFLGKHGTAADNLLGADLVTSDGQMLRVSANENSDLYWALKGGGGNFGVVTSLDLKLHPVDEVVGGTVIYRTDLTQFLRFYRDFMKSAPDELAVELNVVLAREPLIAALVCWGGDPAAAKKVLGPLESFGPPIANNIDPVSYIRLGERFSLIGRILNERSQSPQTSALPSATPRPQTNVAPFNYWRGGSLEELSNGAIDQIVACTQDAVSYSSIGIGHYMHGQACRIEPSATPLTRRQGQLTYFFSASWVDPHIAETQMAWVIRSLKAMKSVASKGTYINYLSSDNVGDVKASYEQSYDRLARIKRKYDPTNFFHLNRNIRPV